MLLANAVVHHAKTLTQSKISFAPKQPVKPTPARKPAAVDDDSSSKKRKASASHVIDLTGDEDEDMPVLNWPDDHTDDSDEESYDPLLCAGPTFPSKAGLSNSNGPNKTSPADNATPTNNPTACKKEAHTVLDNSSKKPPADNSDADEDSSPVARMPMTTTKKTISSRGSRTGKHPDPGSWKEKCVDWCICHVIIAKDDTLRWPVCSSKNGKAEIVALALDQEQGTYESARSKVETTLGNFRKHKTWEVSEETFEHFPEPLDPEKLPFLMDEAFIEPAPGAWCAILFCMHCPFFF